MKYVVIYTENGEKKELAYTTYNEARKTLNKLKGYSPKLELRKE